MLWMCLHFLYVSLRFEVAKRNEVVVLRLTFWLILQVRDKVFVTFSEEVFRTRVLTFHDWYRWKAKSVRFVCQVRIEQNETG